VNIFLLREKWATRRWLGRLSVYRLLPSLLISAASPLSWSEQGDSSEAFDVEVPIVLTPSRLPQRLDESPSTVTVIDRALIEASGARRLAEVFRLVPGFQVGYKYNNQPTVAYHGLCPMSLPGACCSWWMASGSFSTPGAL
jgi:outer membrane receptor protein involved in Fe transport